MVDGNAPTAPPSTVIDLDAPAPGRPPGTAALIFVPGLGRYAANTGTRVAEVIANEASLRAGTYRVEDSRAQAPAGLKVCKTIVGPDDRPALDVFELDYRTRLAELDRDADAQGPPPPPGFFASCATALWALLLLIPAMRRPAKSSRAKLQLLIGLAGVVILFAATVFALLSSLAAMGLLDRLPAPLAPGGSGGDAATVAVVTGASTAGIWAMARRRILTWAGTLRQLSSYIDGPRHRATVDRILDKAIDGMLEHGWTGDIHVVGYSFGSIVVLDCLLPAKEPEPGRQRLADAVTSIVTLGCPADFIRLYRPDYFAGRHLRNPKLTWSNVFIGADVMASNFLDGDDTRPGAHTPGAPPQVSPCLLPSSSTPYLDTKLTMSGLLTLGGLRIHDSYWGGPDEDSCFGLILDRLLPTTVTR